MNKLIESIKESVSSAIAGVIDFLVIPLPQGCEHSARPAPSRFDYVAYDEESQVSQQIFKLLVTDIENELLFLEDGRAKSLALTKLEEFYMWTGKAIRDDQISRNAFEDLKGERGNS